MSNKSQIPEATRHIRAQYREANVPAGYSGMRHLAITSSVSLAVVVGSIYMLSNVQPLEWLTIPLVFLYANLSEFLGHRGPMHHKTKALKILFQRHAVEHHSFFTQDATTIDSSDDFKAVLFPPIMLLFFFGAFATPVALLVYFFVSPNVAFLFAATSTAYFLNYELLHLAYHLEPDSWIGKLPFMKGLRRHHTNHHN